jgi:hypothetical protein
MPWTPKQVRYLLSNGSPLSAEKKQKMKGELHADPAMGHMHKGFVKTLASKFKNRSKK